MVAQQVARGVDEIVKIELGAGALVLTIARKDCACFVDQCREDLAGNHLE